MPMTTRCGAHRRAGRSAAAVMTSADEECGAKAVGAGGAEVALAASRSGMGLGEGAACRRARARRCRWARRGRHGGGLDRGTGGDIIGRGHVHRLGGTRAGVDSSTGVRPALRAASRLAPSATTPMGGRLCPRSGDQRRPVDGFLDAAGVDHHGFVLEEAAGVGHALGQRGAQALGIGAVQDHRIAYRVALLKSRARDSVFILVGRRPGTGKGPVPPARGCRA